jgi:acetyltransferase-like isoleucine patch superfamily enzyme
MRRKFVNGIRKAMGLVVHSVRFVFIRLFCPNLKISWQTKIGKGVTILAMKGSVIDIRGVFVKDYSHLFADEGAVIQIASNVEIGIGNVIVAKNKITIGANTLIAEYVTIRDQNHDLSNLAQFNVAPVMIGSNVWLGAKATVTMGVNIPDGTVVGAHSFVNKSISQRSVVAGIPAKIIKLIE